MDSVVVGPHDERADALGAVLGRAGPGEDGVEVGDPGVGDEYLLAVDDVVIAVSSGGGRDGARIAAGALLGHRKGGNHRPGRDTRQQLELEDVAAGEGDGVGAQALEGEHCVGEATDGGQSLTDEAEAADIEGLVLISPAERVISRNLPPPRFSNNELLALPTER